MYTYSTCTNTAECLREYEQHRYTAEFSHRPRIRQVVETNARGTLIDRLCPYQSLTLVIHLGKIPLSHYPSHTQTCLSAPTCDLALLRGCTWDQLAPPPAATALSPITSQPASPVVMCMHSKYSSTHLSYKPRAVCHFVVSSRL